MRGAAAATLWELRTRHRAGLTVFGLYLLVLVVIRVWLVPGQRMDFDNPVKFAFVVMLPLTSTAMYLIGIFTYGLSGDFAARQSIFPARMFTLPVATRSLVAWPMLYGVTAMLLLWAAWRSLAVWPSGMMVPTYWPGLLGASVVAWTQALTWMPYPLTGMRVVMAMLILAVVDTVAMVGLQLQVRESLMIAVLAPQVPIAFVVGLLAVRKARRGDGVGERAWRAGRAGRALTSFRTAGEAQEWFEWRRHGRALPALVALVLPFQLWLLFIAQGAPLLMLESLLLAFLSPPFLAAFAAATVRQSSAPFIARLPMHGGALIAATLKTAARSTAVAWLLVLVAVPVALWLSGTWPMAWSYVRRFTSMAGTGRSLIIAFLVLAFVVLATWKQLVQSLYIGLSGNEMLIKGSVFVTLALLFSIGPLLEWLGGGQRLALLWDNLTLVPAVFVALKMALALWVVTRLHRSGLLGERAIVLGAAAWCGAVFALYLLLWWLASTPMIARYALLLVAMLFVPLVRLAAAPLALARSRHG